MGIKILLLFISFLLFSHLTKAYEIQEYNLEFSISQNLIVNELLEITFSESLNQTELSYITTGEISNLKINNSLKELDYTIKKIGEENKISFTIPNGTKKLFISFTTKDLIFSHENVFQFFTIFKPPQTLEKFSISIALPEGFVIYRNMISPDNVKIESDGKRIYLKWNFENWKDEIPISIQFYNPYKMELIFLFIPISIFLILIITNYYRHKVRKEFLKGFSEDEKKLINILMKRKVAYQNKLEKELKFSRAKMTRICKKLETKKLIERKKIGRTNKIFWKK